MFWSQRHLWTEKRYWRNGVWLFAIVAYFVWFWASFLITVERKVFWVNPAVKKIVSVSAIWWEQSYTPWRQVIDVDGCDVFLPGSDLYKHDFTRDSFHRGFINVFEDSNRAEVEKCEWMKSPNSMTSGSKDCVVANWLVGDDEVERVLT